MVASRSLSFRESESFRDRNMRFTAEGDDEVMKYL